MTRTLVLLILLAGCAPRPWIKQDTTAAQLDQDRKRCEYEARAAVDDTRISVEAAMMREATLERLCMESKGYARR